MIQLIGLLMMFMATFIIGGVLFVKLDEFRKLYGVKETLLVITMILFVGLILTMA